MSKELNTEIELLSKLRYNLTQTQKDAALSQAKHFRKIQDAAEAVLKQQRKVNRLLDIERG